MWFRDSTKAVANQLEIAGFVRNEPDGSVYIEAEGIALNLEQFLEWCHEGPERAEVESVDSQESEVMQGYGNFVVRKKGIFGGN